MALCRRHPRYSEPATAAEPPDIATSLGDLLSPPSHPSSDDVDGGESYVGGKNYPTSA